MSEWEKSRISIIKSLLCVDNKQDFDLVLEALFQTLLKARIRKDDLQDLIKPEALKN